MILRLLPWIAFGVAIALFVVLVHTAKAEHGPTGVPQAVARWQPLIERHAVRVWGHDRHVARFGAQIAQESGGRPDVYSHAGAAGLGQFMPATWAEMVRLHPHVGSNRLDPDASIGMTVRYMRRLYDMQSRAASGCELWRQTLASYNAGIGRLRRVIRQHGSAWLSHMPRETQGYMKILQRERDYIKAGWPGVAVCAT